MNAPTPTTSAATRSHAPDRPVARLGTGRAGELSRAAAALAALSVAVLGVPVGLAWLTAPLLPRSLPTLGRLSNLLMAHDSGQLLVGALLMAAWIGWALFAASVAVEAAAQLRGRGAPRLPAGPVQDLAARLVATVALAATGGGLLLLPAALPARAATIPAPAAPAPPAATPSRTAPAAAARHVADPALGDRAAAQKVYVVQGPLAGRRDSLWAIAARHLGDPLRWHEIAALNTGRPQPDGGVLQDPHWIVPGWELLMPADATDVQTLAELRLLPPADASRPPVVAAPAAPNPATVPAPVAAVPPTIVTRAAPPASGGGVAPRRSSQAAPPPATPYVGAAGPSRSSAEALELGGAGLLAAGLLAGLARLRAIQRRNRPDRRRLTPPAPGLRVAEVSLRVAAEPGDRQFLDDGLRALTAALTPRGSSLTPLPDPVAARLTAEGLELLLATPNPDPPAPFLPANGGSSWLMPRTWAPHPVEPGDAGVLAALPALTPLGRDQHGLLLLDLEAAGTLSITGEPEQLTAMLRRIAAELAVASWADAVHLVLVGFGTELCALQPERLQDVAFLEERLLRQLEARAAGVLAAGAPGADPVLASRFTADQDPTTPEIILLASPPGEALSRRLVLLAGTGPRTGIGIVVAGHWPAARWQLHLDQAGLLEIPRLGLSLHADTLTEAATGVLTDLFGHARREDTSEPPPDPAPPVTAPLAVAERTGRSHDTSPSRGAPPTGRAELAEEPDDLDTAVSAFLTGTGPAVSVMGPITVRASGPLETKRLLLSTEIVVYVAMHGRRVQHLHRLDEAIWPGQPVRVATRTEAIARTRKWLGADTDGELYLPPGFGDGLTLSEDVLVDWDLFERLVARGRDEDLRLALRLVQGKPFEAIPYGRYGWLAALYLEQDIPVAVIDAAHTLAGNCLRRGDYAGVRDATRIAQLVDPYDERPWRDRIQAEHASGNHGVVKRLAEQMRALLETDLDDVLTDETEQLLARVAPRAEPKAG
jgi:hypothetical protein